MFVNEKRLNELIDSKLLTVLNMINHKADLNTVNYKAEQTTKLFSEIESSLDTTRNDIELLRNGIEGMSVENDSNILKLNEVTINIDGRLTELDKSYKYVNDKFNDKIGSLVVRTDEIEKDCNGNIATFYTEAKKFIEGQLQVFGTEFSTKINAILEDLKSKVNSMNSNTVEHRRSIDEKISNVIIEINKELENIVKTSNINSTRLDNLSGQTLKDISQCKDACTITVNNAMRSAEVAINGVVSEIRTMKENINVSMQSDRECVEVTRKEFKELIEHVAVEMRKASLDFEAKIYQNNSGMDKKYSDRLDDVVVNIMKMISSNGDSKALSSVDNRQIALYELRTKWKEKEAGIASNVTGVVSTKGEEIRQLINDIRGQILVDERAGVNIENLNIKRGKLEILTQLFGEAR